MLMSLLQIWLLSRSLIESPEFEPPFVRGVYAVPFKEVDGEPILLDVLTPQDGVGPFPAVVIVHGGLWVTNDRLQYRDFALGLARRGFAAVNIDFRLDPASGFAGQVNDIKDSIRFLRQHATELNIDPERIGIYGSSSGGHLAAMAAFAGDGEGVDDDPPGTDSSVQSCFLLYGVYVFAETQPEGLFGEIIKAYAGAESLEDAEAYAYWSPIEYINGNEPPTLMVHGEKDNVSPVSIARDVAQEMRENGVPAGVYEWPRHSHGFGERRPWSRPFIFAMTTAFFEATLLN